MGAKTFIWPEIFSLKSHEEFPSDYTRAKGLADALGYLGLKAEKATQPEWVRDEVLSYIAIGLGILNTPIAFEAAFLKWDRDSKIGNRHWWNSPLKS